MALPLTDAVLLSCFDAAPVARTTRISYRQIAASLAGRLRRPAEQNPLLSLLRDPEGGRARLIAAHIAPRSLHTYVKILLALFKHGRAVIDCEPGLAELRGGWVAVHTELNAQAAAEEGRSEMSAREVAAWTPHGEWRAKDAELARAQYGSARHLLIAWHVLWPPVRGGDSGRLFIVDAEDPDTAPPRNVLVWAGPHAPAECVFKEHKTAAKMGPLRRLLPTRLRDIVAASLAAHPRAALFVSPLTHAPFLSERTYIKHANAEFAAVFGRRATCSTARHAYISGMAVERMSTAQLQEVAAMMGHSVAQQRQYYRLVAPAAPLQTPEGGFVVPMRSEEPASSLH